jgi:cytochrome P450
VTIAFPSRLDTEIDFALDDVDDLAGELATLRLRAPFAWGRAFGRPALALLSHELVRDLFMDEDTFPSAEFYEYLVTDVLGRNLQCLYGAEHRRNRALVSPAFRQRLMPGLIGPLLEPVAHELIDRIEGAGAAELVADFTSRYPFLVITRLLGLPHHSEAQIKEWAVAMLDIQQNYDFAVRCSHDFMAFVDPILQHRRDEPGEDLISTLATTEIDGERLSDDEIFNFLRLLFPAGADTTYLGLGSSLLGLLRNPDQLDRVAADPGAECRWAAEEGVRWYPPTAWIPRRNPRDVVWHDIAIPQDAPMMLGILAANRDPAVYDDPDAFDITRRPSATMTFGFGIHFCLGVHLARAEMETSLRVILDRLPRIRLDLDGTQDVRVAGAFNQILQGPNRLPVRFD